MDGRYHPAPVVFCGISIPCSFLGWIQGAAAFLPSKVIFIGDLIIFIQVLKCSKQFQGYVKAIFRLGLLGIW